MRQHTLLRAIVPIGSLIVVLLIAAVLIINADKPISAEGQAAQAWVNAICAGDLATLYRLSWHPQSDEAAFRDHAQRYLDRANLKPGCSTAVLYGQIAIQPTTSQLAPAIVGIKIVPVQFYQPVSDAFNQRRKLIAEVDLMVALTSQNETKVIPGFFGSTVQTPVPFGEKARVYDQNGISMGTVMLTEPATVIRFQGQILVGINLAIASHDITWQYYGLELVSGTRAAQPITNEQDLPKAYRLNFAAPQGDEITQWRTRESKFWFRLDPKNWDEEHLVLMLRARTGPYQMMEGYYLAVKVDPNWVTVASADTWNPFPSGAQLDSAADSAATGGADAKNTPVWNFTLTVSTVGLDESSTFRIECRSFWLKIASGDWFQPKDCNASGGDAYQVYQANESRRWHVRFELPDSGSRPAAQLVYRIEREDGVRAFALWAQAAG